MKSLSSIPCFKVIGAPKSHAATASRPPFIFSEATKNATLLLNFLFFSLALFLATGFVSAQGVSAKVNLMQWSNGKLEGTGTDPSGISWKNGNLNSNNAHIAEGMTVPYRLEVNYAGVQPGRNAPTTRIILQYNLSRNGAIAWDFPTSHDRVGTHDLAFGADHTFAGFEAGILPAQMLAGTALESGASSSGTFPVPPPAYLAYLPGQILTINGMTGDAAAANHNPFDNTGVFMIYNGTIDRIRYRDADGNPTDDIPYTDIWPTESDQINGVNGQDALVQFEIEFTPDAGAEDVVILWGMHVASQYQESMNGLVTWGEGNTAVDQTQGSPYQIQIVSCDEVMTGCGVSPMNIKAGSVVIPPVCETPPTIMVPVNPTEGCEGLTQVKIDVIVGNPGGFTGLPQYALMPFGENNPIAPVDWTDLTEDENGDLSFSMDFTGIGEGVYDFQVKVRYSGETTCESVPAAFSVNVRPDPTVEVGALNPTACAGGTIRLMASPSESDCTLQWQEWITEAWQDLEGQTGMMLNVQSNAIGSRLFRVLAAGCSSPALDCEAVSEPIEIFFVADPSIEVERIGAIPCAGGTGFLKATLSGQQGTCDLIWEERIDDEWVAIAGQSTDELSVVKEQAGDYQFRARILTCDGGSGCAATSSAVTLTFATDPTVTIAQTGIQPCAGGTTQLSASVTSDQAPCSLQWQEFVDGIWVDLENATETALSVSKPEAGDYTFRVRISDCAGGTGCDAISEPLTVVFSADPTVQIQATETATCAGGIVPLTAVIINGKDNCRFQWQAYLNETWVNLPGEDKAVLNARNAEAGVYSYRVKVTACEEGDGCEATSEAFELIIRPDPVVQISTVRQAACVGGTIRLGANVTNPNGECSLQWQEWINESWQDLENQTGIFFSAVKDTPGAYRFRVRITACDGGAGCNAVSQPVDLNFTDDPTISLTADLSSACAGGVLQLNAVVNNGPGPCQFIWEEQVNETWVTIENEQGASLAVSKPEAGVYTFRATAVTCEGSAGCNAISDPFELTFTPDPAVAVTAQRMTACIGGALTLTANVTGGQGCTFQWQQRNGDLWVDLTEQTNPTLNVSQTIAGNYTYRALISGCDSEQACDGASAPFTVTFLADPVISINADTDGICAGGTIVLTAAHTGDFPACIFQWQARSGDQWFDLPNETENTLSVSRSEAGAYQYRVRITACVGNDGCQTISDPYTVNFASDPQVQIDMIRNSTCLGGTIRLVASPQDNLPNCTFIWQENVDGVWTDLEDTNGPILGVSREATGVYQFRVRIPECNGDGGCDALSEPVEVQFLEDPQITIQAGNQKTCAGGIIPFTAEVSNYNGICSIQWQEWLNEQWVNLDNETGTELNLSKNLPGIYRIRAVVIQCEENSDCGAASEPLEVEFAEDPAVLIQTLSNTSCVGGNVRLEAILGENAQSCQIQWQERVNDVWVDVPGANGQVRFVSRAEAGAYYFRVALSDCGLDDGCAAFSDPFEVIFNPDPRVRIDAADKTACAGGTLQLSAIVTGASGNCNIQWEELVGNNWLPIPGAVEPTLNVTKPTVGEYFYRVSVTRCDGGNDCSAVAQAVQVVFEPDPSVSITSPNNEACAGGTIQLAANVIDGAGACRFQWQEFLNGEWVDLPEATASTISVRKETPGSYGYRVKVMACQGNDGCDAVSSPFPVIFTEDPTAYITGGINACVAGKLTLTAVVENGPGGCDLQWQEFKDGIWKDLTGATGESLEITQAQAGAYTYRVQVTGCSEGGGCNARSAPYTVTFAGLPTVSLQPSRTETCVGNGVFFTATAQGGAGCTQVKYLIRREGTEAAFTEIITKDSGLPLQLPADLGGAYTLTPATYTIRAETVCTLDGCFGYDESVLIVREKPVMPADLMVEVCSKDETGIVLTLENPDAQNVLNIEYWITGIDAPGLQPHAGDPFSALGVPSDDQTISDDAWINNGSEPVIVTYTVVPRFQYGEGQYCEGAPRTIKVRVRPQPALSEALGSPVCSESPLEVQLVLQTPPGEEVSDVHFIITHIEANGLEAVDGNPQADPTAFQEAGELADDAWRNEGTLPVEVIYRIIPVVQYGVDDYCYGEEANVSFSIQPAPVMNPVTALTLCTPGNDLNGGQIGTGIVLSVDNDPDQEGNQSPRLSEQEQPDILFRLDAVEGAAGLTPGLSNARPGDISDSHLLLNDTWTNPGEQPVVFTYRVTPLAVYQAGTDQESACYGAAQRIRVTVMPNPSVDVELIISGVDYPNSGSCDHFDAILELEICNNGPVNIEALAVELDLASLTSGLVAGLSKAPVHISGKNLDAFLNPGFDGLADQAVFLSGSAALQKGECTRYRLQMEIAPPNAGGDAAVSNAIFSASVVAQGDWAGLAQGDVTFDANHACNTLTGRSETSLGQCWWRSRTVAANDLVNVTLDENCQALITPDMLLEGYKAECGQDAYPQGGFYRLVVIKPGDVTEGPFTEVVLDAADFNDGRAIILIENVGRACLPLETELQLEDKTNPEFGAYDTLVTHIEMEKPIQRISGAVSEQDQQITLKNYVCFNEDAQLPDCANDYELITFEVDKTDFFTIELSMPEALGLLALYQGDFDPAEPCANIIAQNDRPVAGDALFEPGDAAGRIRLVLPLKPGVPYTLLVASTDCNGDADNYHVYFCSDAGGKILNASKPVVSEVVSLYYPLLCTDIDRILNESASTSFIPEPPVLSDCTPNMKWFEDELINNGDCGLPEIRRTWYVRDELGREGIPVVQTIRFSRPGLADIYQPAKTAAVECDELSEELLDENGYPLPTLTGSPFIVSAFGIHDLNGAVCNIGASYRQISDVTVCADTRMVVREWTFTDWCDAGAQNDPQQGLLTTYRQIIHIGDFSAPVVTAPSNIVIPTTPFGCSGILTIATLEATDNCSATINTIARVYQRRQEPVLDRFGRETGEVREVLERIHTGGVGDEVPDIQLGFTYLVEYAVSDACGNMAAPVTYEVTVEDKIAPSVICNDELNISVGGDGLGRLHASDVDEGSWDNCALDALLISRELGDDALRDAYLQQVYNLGFNQLQLSNQPDPSGQIAETWVRTEAPQEAILRRKNGRWYTAWKEDQWFICEDIGISIRIELAAIDVFGNANVCDLTVTIEDKSAPYCVAPPNVMLACTDLPAGFDPADDAQLSELFGTAGAQDNCSATATQINKVVQWDCNSGTITRFFRATDRQGLQSLNTCKQIVTVYPVHEYEIKFPRDASAECGLPVPDTIQTTEIACDLLSVNVIDERFTSSENACFMIRRTYRVINWCEYDGESAPVQVTRNPDCDGESGEEDVYILVRANGVTYIDRDNDETTGPANSPCGNGAQGHLNNSALSPELTSTGYWQYQQFIRVFDRTEPEVAFAGETVFCSQRSDCTGEASFPLTVTDVCAGADIAIQVFLAPDPATGLPTEIDLQQMDNAALVHFQLQGAYPDYTISGRFPIGDHQLIVLARDGCGNTTRREIDFRIVDCKAPAPVCINGLVIELMPLEGNADVDGDGDADTGAMSITAADFRIGGLSECSEPVVLSINRQGETPDRNQTSLMLTCDDIDTVFVEIYAWDNAGNPFAVQPDGSIGGPNYDLCQTYVVVQDNLFDLCTSSASVSGLIATRDDDPVENVEVKLSGQMVSSVFTTADGTYTFDDLTIGGDYTISPLRDDNHRNGVSTFDLILITKHLLRTRPMTNPYQIIAADVNRSNSVTALDVIHLRKLLLTIYLKFPASESWRFTPANYRFPDPGRPFMEDLPEVLNYNDVKTAITSGDFVGMKVGDVNGSALPNSQITTPRSISGLFNIELNEEDLQAGQTYRVPFTARNLADIQGYQFTLGFDAAALELVDIEYGLATAESFGWTYADEGMITTSWVKDLAWSAATADPAAPLFTLVLRAEKPAKLSDLLYISSRYLEAEAYSEADEILGVQLQFRDQNGSLQTQRQSPELYQNTPNPWTAETQIAFYLPEPGEATLSIRDVQGRTLKHIRADFAAGFHQLNFEREDLPAGGVLYYTLETGGFVATKKMVVVE